jgi:hypothetical protein
LPASPLCGRASLRTIFLCSPFPRLSLQLLRQPTLPVPTLSYWATHAALLLMSCALALRSRPAPAPAPAAACPPPLAKVSPSGSSSRARPNLRTCTPHAPFLACMPHHLRPPRREHRYRPGEAPAATPPAASASPFPAAWYNKAIVPFLSPIRMKPSGAAPPKSSRYHVDLRTAATSTSSGQWKGTAMDRNLATPNPKFQVVHHPPMSPLALACPA